MIWIIDDHIATDRKDSRLTFEKLKVSGTLSDRAYKALKESILYLELKPGAVLIEEELSEKLGISRTPIREALKRLSYEGLISFHSGRRTHVTDLSLEVFLNVAAVRESLELLAVRLASIHRTDQDIKLMTSLADKQRALLDAPDLDTRQFLFVDRKYHMAIVTSSHNDFLVKYITEINEAFHRYLYYTEFNHRAMNVVSEHKEIINPITARDSNKAEILMMNHLSDVKESIILALSKM